MRFSRYEINPELCRRCGACLKACPRGAVEQTPEHRYVIDQARCDACGTCAASCKLRAIAKRKGLFR